MLRVFAEVLLPVLLVAAVGGAAGRRLRIPVKPLADLVFFVFSPALVFVSIADIDLASGEIVRIVAVVVAVFAANLALAVGWSRLRRDDARTAATGALAASLPNHGNLGLPIAALALGDAGLRVAVVAFTAGASLQSSAGVAVGSAGRAAANRVTGRRRNRRHLLAAQRSSLEGSCDSSPARPVGDRCV